MASMAEVALIVAVSVSALAVPGMPGMDFDFSATAASMTMRVTPPVRLTIREIMAFCTEFAALLPDGPSPPPAAPPAMARCSSSGSTPLYMRGSWVWSATALTRLRIGEAEADAAVPSAAYCGLSATIELSVRLSRTRFHAAMNSRR